MEIRKTAKKIDLWIWDLLVAIFAPTPKAKYVGRHWANGLSTSQVNMGRHRVSA